MIKIAAVKILKAPMVNQAVLSIDADPAAERVIIMARDTGDVFHNFTYQSNKQLKFIVPLTYSVNADLLVGILDDDRVYNTKFVDGVKSELIDGNTVNIRP